MPRIHGEPAASWWGTTTPPSGPNGTTPTYVGIDFEVLVAGRINGFRLYRQAADSSTHYALLFGLQVQPGRLWVAKAFVDDTAAASGWQNAWIRPWFRPDPNTDYRLAIFFEAGKFFRQTNALGSGAVAHNNISFIHGWQNASLDIFSAGATVNSNANAVDILFQPD
jgi:hypothetical protein